MPGILNFYYDEPDMVKKKISCYHVRGRRGYTQCSDSGRCIGERTNQTWVDQPAGFYYTVVDAMLKTGFSESEIGKIGGENYIRVFDAATAGHS